MRLAVNDREWFRFFGGRQCGKSTALWQLRAALNATPDHLCLMMSCQNIVKDGERWDTIARRLRDSFVSVIRLSAHRATPEAGGADFDCAGFISLCESSGESCSFMDLLSAFTLHVDPSGTHNHDRRDPVRVPSTVVGGRAVVVLLDEFDRFPMPVATNILDDMRAWYHKGDIVVPCSIVLCGAVDVALRASVPPSPGRSSPFNIADSLYMPAMWGRKQIRDLAQQHADARGVELRGDALERLYEATSGQPWQVCAILREACFEDVTDNDIMVRQAVSPVTRSVVERAIALMISLSSTHSQSLRNLFFTDERIQRVYRALSEGEPPSEADLEFATAMQVVKGGPREEPAFANLLVEETLHRSAVAMAQDKRGTPRTFFAAHFSACFGAAGPPKWTELLKVVVGEFLVGAIGAETPTRAAADHIELFRRLREAYFQFHMHAWIWSIMNGGGFCWRERRVTERRFLDEATTLFPRAGDLRTYKAAWEWKYVHTVDGAPATKEQLKSEMGVAVAQAENAMAHDPLFTTGMAVVFTTSVAAPLAGGPCEVVAADDPAFDPLPALGAGKEIIRVIVRLHTHAATAAAAVEPRAKRARRH
jgi:hypothetical protein